MATQLRQSLILMIGLHWNTNPLLLELLESGRGGRRVVVMEKFFLTDFPY